ncbi:glycosyltransferase family 4 protein, partial [Candidatus Dependentiae bacterium]|nr:glycosyltransferase family 4 protein [Candidatus Dependentiae bacterium]
PTTGPLGWYDFPHTKVWWLRWYHMPHLCKALWHTLVTLLFIAPRLYLDKQPALVHLNTSSLIAWAAAAWAMRIPVVWHIREPLADGYFGIRKAFIRWCVQTFATKIIAISQHDGKPWAGNKKLSIIYNAVPVERFDYAIDPTAFCQQYHLQAQKRILFVGGCSQEKGTLVLLQAFEKVLETIPTAQLLIAGYMPEKIVHKRFFTPAARFKSAVISLLHRHQKNITLLGAIKEIPAAMASADIIVFPATVGHFARPIIEAGFMKKPVIATAVAPLDELVIPDVTGLLVPSNDPVTLANALKILLTDQHKSTTMGQAGYDYCSVTFSLPLQRDKIMQLYAHLLKGDHYEPLGS